MIILQFCFISQRLDRLEHEAAGNLFGHFHDGTLVVAGFGIVAPKSVAACLNGVPSEIQVCGAFTTGTKVEEAQAHFSQISRVISFLLRMLNYVLCTECFVKIIYNSFPVCEGFRHTCPSNKCEA